MLANSNPSETPAEARPRLCPRLINGAPARSSGSPAAPPGGPSPALDFRFIAYGRGLASCNGLAAGRAPDNNIDLSVTHLGSIPGSPGGLRGTWMLAAAGVLVAGVAIALALVTSPESRGLKAVPLLVLLGGLVLTLRRERRLRGLSLFSPFAMAMLAYGVMFVVVPLADLAFDHPLARHTGWWSASWLAVAGFALMVLGYRLVVWRRTEPVDRSSDGSPRLVAVLSLSLLTVSVISVLAWISSFTDLPTYIANFGARTRLFPRPSSSILIPASLAAPAVVLQAANVARDPSTRRVVLFLLFWLLPGLLVSGFAGQRWRDLAILVAVASVYHLGWRRLSPRAVAATLAVLALAFVVWGQQRNVVGTLAEGPSLLSANIYYDYVGQTHELGQFRDFVITYEGIPDVVGYQYGATLLSLIPGAPFPTAGQVYSTAFYGDLYRAGTSIPTPLPGELYMNFALPGVAAGMLLFGGLLGVLESYRRREPAGYGRLAVYCYSILPLALVLRGDVTTFLGYWIVGLIPLLLAVGLVEGRLGRLVVRNVPALGSRGA